MNYDERPTYGIVDDNITRHRSSIFAETAFEFLFFWVKFKSIGANPPLKPLPGHTGAFFGITSGPLFEVWSLGT